MTLNEIEMFHGLSNVELAKIVGRLEKLQFQAGEVLFEQGDSGDSMYIIQQGHIELFAVTPEGSRQALAVLTDGDTLGEMALLTEEPRSATAVTVLDSVLYKMDQETFQKLIEEQPIISAYFIRSLSQRLIQTNVRLQASKEDKSKWLQLELAQLPESLVECILASALLPSASLGLLQSASRLDLPQNFSWSEELERFPVLRKFVQIDSMNEEWFCVVSAVRTGLAELFVLKYGHAVKQQWIKEAATYWLSRAERVPAFQLYTMYEEWDALLEAMSEHKEPLDSNDPNNSKDPLELLDRCPQDRLFAHFSVFERYIQMCGEQGREAGFASLEKALEHNQTYFTMQQTITLYERGAELCRKLEWKQKALEYLQMADTLTLSIRHTAAGVTIEHEDRKYQLAKQKLDGHRSKLLADRAGGLLKRTRLSAAFAVVFALTSLLYFHYTAPFAGLDRNGMEFIGIGIAAVALWIVNIVPDYLVALFMAMFWVVGGLVEPEVALSGFASSTWLYMLFILALGAVITKSGILYRLSLHALKKFPAHYRGQLWGIVAGGAALNPLIPSSSAKVALGVPIAQTLSESMGFPDKSHGAAGLGLAAMVFYGFTAPFVMTGSYTNVMAYGLVPGGESVTWFQWFLYALPAFLIFSAVILVYLLVRFKKVTPGKVISPKVLDDQLRLLGKWTREERITVYTVLGCIGLMIAQPLHELDNTWIMLIGFAVLVMSGVLDTQTLKSGIDWPFLLFIGIAFSFAQAAEQLGIVEAMSAALSQPMSMFLSSPTLFLLAVIVLSFLVTLVVRDDPAVILLVISMLPLAEQAGIHPWVLVFIILLSTDPFFFAYQSPTYLTAYYSAEGKPFSHRQGQMVAIGYGLAVVAVAVVCTPYWQWIGLIRTGP